MFLKWHVLTYEIEIVTFFAVKKKKQGKGTNPQLNGTLYNSIKPGLFRANQNNIYNLTREPERKRDQEMNGY